MDSSELISNSVQPAGKTALNIQGVIYSQGDQGYDQARQAWNLSIDQRPALIVIAESVRDIQEAVRYAVNQGLTVAVQSTGHGVARKADDALLILTSRLDEVQIDPASQTARMQAGVKWGKVLELAQEHGLAPLLGSSPGVGVVGYSLGGGFGWLGRKYGMAVDSIRSINLVNAAGDLITASEKENSDLFWALRGGGGGFGVVTELEIQLYPVTTVYGGNLFYPAELAKDVLTRFKEFSSSAPEELTCGVNLMSFPPIPLVPEPLRGKTFAIFRGCYAGPVEEGEALINTWREWKAPVMDMFHAMPFTQVATISQDPIDPMPASVTTAWMRELNDEAIDALVKYGIPEQGPLPLTFIEVRQAGGAISRVDPDANAYGNRDAAYCMECIGMTPSPEAQLAFMAHTSQLKTELKPALTGGVYLNFLDSDEARLRVKDAFPPETYQKLQEIKAKYDKDNIFCHGFNISSSI
jgi:FAD/FMN-containing dehydrogenase